MSPTFFCSTRGRGSNYNKKLKIITAREKTTNLRPQKAWPFQAHFEFVLELKSNKFLNKQRIPGSTIQTDQYLGLQASQNFCQDLTSKRGWTAIIT
jgi:hypothetical protein